MLEYFNKSLRCQCKNINFQICKNKQTIFLNINKKRTCNHHIKYLYLKHIIKIQKIYRGYKCRNKINYFYKRLPDDIQYLIKFHINKELYEKRIENKIKTIVNRNLLSFNIEMQNLFNTNVLFIDEFLNYKNKILNYFNMINKYNSLVDESTKKSYIHLDHVIISYINTIKYYNDYNSNNQTEINFKKIKLDIIGGMLNYYYYSSNIKDYSEC
jgi:hypothetical protein